MPGAYLKGWHGDTPKWVKIKCDSSGRIFIDPTLILENPPTEDESKKAASSEWSFDHDADASAHHAKYTDANSRGAISDIFGADGKADAQIDLDRQDLNWVEQLFFSGKQGVSGSKALLVYTAGTKILSLLAYTGWSPVASIMTIHNGTFYETVAVEPVVDTKIEDHRLITNAHHDKYTDNDAQSAVNMVGNLYWSCAGINFSTLIPDTDTVLKTISGAIQADSDDITFLCSVNLPHGCTITSVIVYGNVAAEAETWTFVRLHPIDQIAADKANNNINSADNTVTDPVVDNTNYNYFIKTSSLDTNDIIYGARITYTL